MLNMKRDGIIGKFLWDSTLSDSGPRTRDVYNPEAEHWYEEWTEVSAETTCHLIDRFLSMFALHLFMYTVVAAVLHSMVFTALVFFGWLITPEDSVWIGPLVVGSVAWLVLLFFGLCVGVRWTWHNLSKVFTMPSIQAPEPVVKAKEFTSAVYLGWKEKFCPVVDVK
jgi:hypothetical protein